MRTMDLRWIVIWLSLSSWAAMGFAWSDNRNAAGESEASPPQVESLGGLSASAESGSAVR